MKDNNFNKLVDTGRQINTFSNMKSASSEDVVKQIDDLVSRHTKIVVAGDKSLIERSNKELDLVRKMVRNNTARTGNYKESMIKKLNNSVIQSESAIQVISQHQTEAVDSITDSFNDNLPSVDSILGAVSIGNPVVGFGLKILKDSANRLKDGKKSLEARDNDLRKISESEASATEEAIQKGLSSNTDTDELIRLREKVDNVKEAVNKQTAILSGYLIRLNKSFGVGGEEATEVTRSGFGQLEDKITELTRITDESITEESDLVREKEIDKLEAEREKSNANKLLDGDDDVPVEEEKGIISGLLGAIIIPLKGLFKFITGGIKSILRFAIGPVGLLIAASALFATGFTDAANILEKAEDDLDFGDKVAAGVGRIIGFVGDIGDWVAGVFGIETNFGEDLTKASAKAINGVFEYLSGLLTDFLFFTLETIPNAISDGFDSAVSFMTEKFGGFLDNPLGFLVDKLSDGVQGLFDLFDVDVDVSGFFGDIASITDDILDGINNMILDILPDATPDFIKNLFTSDSTATEYQDATAQDIANAVDSGDLSAEDADSILTSRGIRSAGSIHSQNLKELDLLSTGQPIQISRTTVDARSTNVSSSNTAITTRLNSGNNESVFNDINNGSMGLVAR